MKSRYQVTIRQWLRLPRDERARRVRLFRAAAMSLHGYHGPDGSGHIGEDDEIYCLLNDRVHELWPTVPWWRR